VATGLMNGLRFPTGTGISLFAINVHTDSGVHPASYPMGTGGS